MKSNTDILKILQDTTPRAPESLPLARTKVPMLPIASIQTPLVMAPDAPRHENNGRILPARRLLEQDRKQVSLIHEVSQAASLSRVKFQFNGHLSPRRCLMKDASVQTDDLDSLRAVNLAQSESNRGPFGGCSQ